jgi:hypothetical protein
MNKSNKLTPGPWSVAVDTDRPVHEYRVNGPSRFASGKHAPHLATINSNLINEREANALLIAAAPEMFELLEKLNVHLTALNAEGRLPNDKQLNKLIQQSFDLISQTTGGAS